MGEYLELVTTFFKIGIFTFGGGLAMLPMLESEVVDKRGWASKEELLDYYAIGQCTPGIIAVNTATFIGYKQKRTLGAVLTTLGVILPSLIIITIIAWGLAPYMGNAMVQSAFKGVRVGVCAILAQSIYHLWKSGVKDIYGVCGCFLSFILVGFLNVSPIYIVLVIIVIAIIKTKIEGGKQ